MKERTKRILVIIFWAAALAWAAIDLLTSCKSIPEPVVVERVRDVHHHHTDTIHKTDSIRDHTTTIIRELDSAAMSQYGIHLLSQAERAWLVETNRLQREVNQLRESHTDTLTVRDSVPVPYPVVEIKEVPRDLTWWQYTLMGVGALFLIVMIVFVVFDGRR